MNAENIALSVSDDVKTLIPADRLGSLAEEFLKLDGDRDGKITLAEFGEFSLAQLKSVLAKRFQGIDTDQDGFITFEEFAIASEPKFRILKEFRELDLDRNGLVSTIDIRPQTSPNS